ncbi:MAG: hypothetical protein ACAH89_03875 [Rariglobus sp.]|nr:hypothetical protein [Rariglobus sp.]
MKALPLLLAASLIANAAFVTVIARRSSFAHSSSVSSVTPSSRPTAGAASASASGLPSAETLAKLDGTDLPAYIIALRATGLPPHLVRALVNAELNERFKAREEALKPKRKTASYWESEDYYENNQDTLENRLARLDLRREKDDLRRQLLGEDPPRADDTNPIPPAKRESVRRISEDYDAMIQQINIESRDNPLASDREKLAFLRAEKEKEIRTLLTPEEYAAHELRTSETSRQLRWQLGAFKPSEEEFLRIHALMRADPELARNPDNSYGEEDWQRRRAAEKKLRESLRVELGPERFKDYERAKDYSYQQLTQLNRRLNLPAAVLNEIYDQKTTVPQAAIAIAKDPSLDLAAKRAAITKLVADTRRKVTDSLGAEAGEAYLKRGNVHWLTNLEKDHISVQIDENSWTSHSIEQLAAESQITKK